MRTIYTNDLHLKRKIIDQVTRGGRFFQVGFVKLDGSYRMMTCKLGVTKHLKGGVAYSKDNLLTVFDMDKLSYRHVNLDTLSYLKCGEEVRFV